VLLRIEVPPEQVEQAIEKTYRDLSRKVKIPGFRPGKAPRTLIERYLGGSESVHREGVDRAIDDSFREALRETDTHPIGDPDMSERPEYHPGQPLVFEATVPVGPHIELGDYKSIRLQPIAVEATSEQVNRFLDELLQANATWTPVERGAQDHDQVLIDVVGTAGTMPILYGVHGETILQSEGGQEVYNVKGHEHAIDVKGSVEFAPGFDEELIGLKAGADKRFGLTLPADFRDPDLANKSIVFSVKVDDVKERHLLELNDEFAKTVGAGETLAELRETVRLQLQLRLEREARALFDNALVEIAVSRSTVDVPEVLVERQIESQISDVKADLVRDKVLWHDYLDRAKTTEEKLRLDLRDPALNTLRGLLVLREIAREEGIKVTPAEVMAQIDQTAAQYGRAKAVVRERLSTRDEREKIESRIFYGKAVARLAEIAQQPADVTQNSPSLEVAASTESENGDRCETTNAPVASAVSSEEGSAPVLSEESTANG